MMQVNSLIHTSWECKYHIVFIPKYRRKIMSGQIRKDVGDILHYILVQSEKMKEKLIKKLTQDQSLMGDNL